jgi:hypothetical protein
LGNRFFEILNTLSHSKQDQRDSEDFEQLYQPYVADLYFSLFIDTIMDANRMNRLCALGSDIPKSVHYGYYLNKIRPAKRFSKRWPKAEKDDVIELIKDYYGYSTVKAKEALAVLSEEQIKEIIKKSDRGDKNNERGHY